MADLTSNLRKSREYSVIYSGMRGVDLSLDGSEISKHRFAYLENMYKDYDGTGSGIVESIPGYRRILEYGRKINGLFSYKDTDGCDRLVVHAGSTLHDLDINGIEGQSAVSSVTGVKEAKSTAYQVNGALYVLDGRDITMLSNAKRCKIDEFSGEVYTPTTYHNGEEYEQRNLLTRRFKETNEVYSSASIARETPGLKYVITDEEGRKCKLTGTSGDDTVIYIPSRTLIGDEYYYVTEIENRAFYYNSSISECYIAEGISKIGYMAFCECRALTKVIMPDTVTYIGNGCFSNCLSLTEVHFGRTLSEIGNGIFSICPELKSATYSGSEADFAKIININSISDLTMTYDHVIPYLHAELNIKSPAISIESVTLAGTNVSFETIYDGNIVKGVGLYISDKGYAEGKTVEITGTLSSSPTDYSGKHSGFLASSFAKEGEVAKVITGCTLAEIFDDRIFLSGNPKYPGFVFYTSLGLSGECEPLYFGDLNYFKDGIGNFENTSLLAAGDSLIVFKANDALGGSIYYHTASETGIDIIPKIYPVSSIHSGVQIKGRAISFFDEPVFLSEKGLIAIKKQQINLERSIESRSRNVNPRLLTENLSDASLAVWRGYLAILTDGRVYLADSRETFSDSSGKEEYEWYMLSGIGSYKSDMPRYKYASMAHTGYHVHSNTDTHVTATVYSTSYNGAFIYYVKENGLKYEVYPTGERYGGTFYPAKLLLCVGEKLFFANDVGDVMLFNNDKRGVPPPEISAESGFDPDDYRENYGRRIHPYFYAFAGHAPRYAVMTKKDNCGMPHLEKSTVRGSLAVKCRAVGSGTLAIEVGADNTGYRELCTIPNVSMQFSDVDFSSLALGTDEVYTIPIRDQSRGWIEKQLTIYTNSYGAPFGIYSIAYRFTVKGKIKKTR